MKPATQKQINYINKLYKGVYTDEQLAKLTTITASNLIQCLKRWCNPTLSLKWHSVAVMDKLIEVAYIDLLRAEKRAFGECVSDVLD